jgi:hypothetical protein
MKKKASWMKKYTLIKIKYFCYISILDYIYPLN